MKSLIYAARFACYGWFAAVVLGCAHVDDVGDGYTLRSHAEVQAVFERHGSELHDVYKGFLHQKRDMGGKLVLRLTILPSGRVSGCRVHETDIANPAFGKALCVPVSTFDFGAKNIERVTLNYPLYFYPP